MTNGFSRRAGGPILLVSGSDMGTEGKLMVYNNRGGGYGFLYPNTNPMRVINYFFATDKGLIRKDSKVISDRVRTREE